MSDLSLIEDLAKEVALEVKLLTEGKEKMRQIRDELMQAGYKEGAACKRIAEVISLDYRTLQKWVGGNGPLNSAARLKVMLFLDQEET